MKCKVCGKECGKYVVCYNHRETEYIDYCKLHKNTTFINRQCQLCKKLKEPIYIVKENKDRFGNMIDKKHFLYPYLPRLTHLTRQYQNKYNQKLSHNPGVYGIFYNNICLYIGQSVDISKRIKQHKDNFKTAQHQINGTRAHKKRISISKMKHKVEYKYYQMAYSYKLTDLTFKRLFAIPKMTNEFEFNELLTYAEQAMMITYKPKFNRISARPTKK